MRRKIPIFKVILQNGAKYSQITKIPEIKKIIFEETVYAIKDGVERNMKSISLFEIADCKYYINLDKSQWKIFLNNAIEFYVNIENYEKCGECKKLIEKIK